MKGIDVSIVGIKCDNPECDYRDDTVKFKDFKKYLNKPCPKCGHIVLSQEDYDACKMLMRSVRGINRLFPRRILKELKKEFKAIMSELGDEPVIEIPEKAENKATHNLVEMFEEIFWSIYRKDDDLDELRVKMIEVGIANEESYSVLFDSIKKSVEAFSEMKGTTKKQDNEFIHAEMTKLADTLKVVYPEMIHNQFEFV